MEENIPLEKKVLILGKFFIPYIGDKAYHESANRDRELIDKKEFDFPKWMITGMEPLFYITKYAIYGTLAYEIGKKFL